MTTRHLERLALDAHQLNWTWDQFWQAHADAILQAAPWNRGRYHRLVNRLLSLVVSGDTDGQQPVGDDVTPWDAAGKAVAEKNAESRLTKLPIPVIITA